MIASSSFDLKSAIPFLHWTSVLVMPAVMLIDWGDWLILMHWDIFVPRWRMHDDALWICVKWVWWLDCDLCLGDVWNWVAMMHVLMRFSLQSSLNFSYMNAINLINQNNRNSAISIHSLRIGCNLLHYHHIQ